MQLRHPPRPAPCAVPAAPRVFHLLCASIFIAAACAYHTHPVNHPTAPARCTPLPLPLPLRTISPLVTANSSTQDPPKWCRARSSRRARAAKIVCVGDIHGDWNAGDERALRALAPDLVLFVGDYGDEDVELTRRVRRFADGAPFAVATVFGNHDAYHTTSLRRRMRSPFGIAAQSCRVAAQMANLRAYDVSFRAASFDTLALSVVGGRSFSIGGGHPLQDAPFFRRFLGVRGLADSAARIARATRDTRFRTLVLLAHAGPVGLGARPEDPCGRDWGARPGGDFGDTDLRAGIEHARAQGLRVPLVVFGHMHKRLMAGRGERVMATAEPDGGSGRDTVMVNAAVVPRHRADGHGRTLHHFQVVRMASGGDVASVEETWVRASGAVVDVTRIYQASNVGDATSETSSAT